MSSKGIDIQQTRKANPRASLQEEHKQQVQLFKWIDEYALIDKRFENIAALPNAGKRTYAMANWYKQEGLRKGLLDIVVFVQSQGFGGMLIEMKAPGRETKPRGGLSPEQVTWRDRLINAGYKVVVCYSAEEAKTEICKYFGIVVS